jgi:hypothetical protein
MRHRLNIGTGEAVVVARERLVIGTASGRFAETKKGSSVPDIDTSPLRLRCNKVQHNVTRGFP